MTAETLTHPNQPAVWRDSLDRELLALLQTNARAPAAELARRLGIARTTVLSRLSRLERDGIIAGYTVRLAQDMLAQGLQAFVGLTVQPKAGRSVEASLNVCPKLGSFALSVVSSTMSCCCTPNLRCA